jgi:aminocarboxymuconate-semialdehyde decarboxylase
MPELLSYWLTGPEAAQLLRYVNEQTARLIEESSGHFVGFAGVPLQCIDLAIAELQYCMEDLGFLGVEIGSNVNGAPIGDPRFNQFFEACVELGAAVFVHPLRPTGMDRLVGAPQLQHALAFPTEIGLAAASVVTSGLIVRWPTLRIAFSHGGGTWPSLLPRLERAFEIFPALRNSDVTPRQQSQRLYYDSLVFDTCALRYLVETVGDSQVMVGTDYPFAFSESDPVCAINRAKLVNEQRDKLFYDNARRFLAL